MRAAASSGGSALASLADFLAFAIRDSSASSAIVFSDPVGTAYSEAVFSKAARIFSSLMKCRSVSSVRADIARGLSRSCPLSNVLLLWLITSITFSGESWIIGNVK